jgi:hypothetical protein
MELDQENIILTVCGCVIFNRNSRFYIKSDSNGTEIFKCGANEAMYSFKNIIKIITNEDAGRLITRCEKLLVLL